MSERFISAGTRVGNWFLWLDVQVADLGKHEKTPVVTARRAISGGDVISREIATLDMANALRRIALSIEKAVAEATPKDDNPEPQP